jgi:hypothetical protein
MQSLLQMNGSTQLPNATNRPIFLNTQDERKGANEIYVDLIERLTVLFSAKVRLIALFI